eukprot:scaffold34982_cov27-Tisochrysis_lutea.AAC.4
MLARLKRTRCCFVPLGRNRTSAIHLSRRNGRSCKLRQPLLGRSYRHSCRIALHTVQHANGLSAGQEEDGREGVVEIAPWCAIQLMRGQEALAAGANGVCGRLGMAVHSRTDARQGSKGRARHLRAASTLGPSAQNLRAASTAAVTATGSGETAETAETRRASANFARKST